MTKPLSLPIFENLPNTEEIVQISQWLNEAGLNSLELSNTHGTRFRICVETAKNPAESSLQQNIVATQQVSTDISITAPYFGHLLLCNPVTMETFAPIGSSVCKGAIVAILQIDDLTLPVTASDNGTVVQILAKDGDLVGYGQPILKIQSQ